MIRKLINIIKEWRFAKSQSFLLMKEGTLLNAFYKSKTIFLHIPKTAGTSLVYAIYGDVKGGGHRSISFYRYILAKKIEEYFTFCFVRNPYSRLYSTYQFLSKGGVNQHDRLAFKMHLEKYNDFEDFVINGLNTKIIYEIVHLMLIKL